MFLFRIVRRIVVTLIVLGILVTGFLFGLSIFYPIRYSEYIAEFAEKHGLPLELVYAVIHTESRFRANVVSSAGAKGLMQLMPNTAEWVAGQVGLADFDFSQAGDPRINIWLGCWYLSYMIRRFGVLDTALAAYNAGPGNVSSWLRNEERSVDGINLYHIPFGETRRYVERVNAAMPIYRTMLDFLDGRFKRVMERIGRVSPQW